eukprot:CAMPEP_0198232008 /NCGR_PEP_ID=MMETSP1445-20131203/115501_1 /TAXON_ID=36898 /ORGANISM="Pyramimonas sp., Strain CCMP2087" /LENGTH=330 /DNA_ID=CAMNT_0043912655 /DNA_START=379 /DNA_END=1368 /DNA_ORIENTATION=+
MLNEIYSSSPSWREYDREFSKLLEDIPHSSAAQVEEFPRTISAPPYLGRAALGPDNRSELLKQRSQTPLATHHEFGNESLHYASRNSQNGTGLDGYHRGGGGLGQQHQNNTASTTSSDHTHIAALQRAAVEIQGFNIGGHAATSKISLPMDAPTSQVSAFGIANATTSQLYLQQQQQQQQQQQHLALPSSLSNSVSFAPQQQQQQQQQQQHLALPSSLSNSVSFAPAHINHGSSGLSAGMNGGEDFAAQHHNSGLAGEFGANNGLLAGYAQTGESEYNNLSSMQMPLGPSGLSDPNASGNPQSTTSAYNSAGVGVGGYGLNQQQQQQQQQ